MSENQSSQSDDTTQNQWTLDEDGDPTFDVADPDDLVTIVPESSEWAGTEITISDKAHAALVQCIRDAEEYRQIKAHNLKVISDLKRQLRFDRTPISGVDS